jgi:transcriptional regulator with XRE-family HTH domain
MPEARGSRSRDSSIGSLLQGWRKARQLSQLALATQAEISSRHLCFIETGRANPSREMVLLLAGVLDVPLRERNALLLAAGFAPVYRESTMDAPELAAVRRALDAILAQQEPFPAVVMNRSWDVVRTNQAAARLFGLLLGERAAAGPANVLHMMFDPAALRPFVANWDAVAEALVHRVHREAIGGVHDEPARRLLAEIGRYPGVPAARPSARPGPPTGPPIVPVVPVRFRKGALELDFFSTVTTLGTPQDITVQEVRLECFFPADEATARTARRLAAEPARSHRARRPAARSEGASPVTPPR